jgi:hypothetical protein
MVNAFVLLVPGTRNGFLGRLVLGQTMGSGQLAREQKKMKIAFKSFKKIEKYFRY